MNADEFREQGKKMIDYVAKYLDTIGDRRVTPNVEPGYLKSLIPLEAPEIGEKFDDIMADIEPKIMNGMVRDRWDVTFRPQIIIIACVFGKSNSLLFFHVNQVHWQHPRFHAYFPSGAS